MNKVLCVSYHKTLFFELNMLLAAVLCRDPLENLQRFTDSTAKLTGKEMEGGKGKEWSRREGERNDGKGKGDESLNVPNCKIVYANEFD